MMDAWAAADRKKSGGETAFAELYPTPVEATRALLGVESFPRVVWEPASGLGHISRVLEARGHEVISTDLHAARHKYGSPADFLAGPNNPPGGAEAIVTNSPYSLLRPFMVRALTAPGVRKVALFTPFEALRVKSNVAIWREHGFPRAYLLVPTLTIDCGEKGMVKSIFNHMWLVWDTKGEERCDCIELRHLFWKETGVENLL